MTDLAAFARRGWVPVRTRIFGKPDHQTEAFDLPVDDNGGGGWVHLLPGAVRRWQRRRREGEVRNNGLLDQANFPVSYPLDNGPVTTTRTFLGNPHSPGLRPSWISERAHRGRMAHTSRRGPPVLTDACFGG